MSCVICMYVWCSRVLPSLPHSHPHSLLTFSGLFRGEALSQLFWWVSPGMYLCLIRAISVVHSSIISRKVGSTLSPLSKPYAPLTFPTVWTPHSSKLSYCVYPPSSQHVRLSTSAVVLVIEWSWSLTCLRNVSPAAHWVTTSLSMSPTALYSWRPTR